VLFERQETAGSDRTVTISCFISRLFHEVSCIFLRLYCGGAQRREDEGTRRSLNIDGFWAEVNTKRVKTSGRKNCEEEQRIRGRNGKK
jgi:hypothetical protein